MAGDKRTLAYSGRRGRRKFFFTSPGCPAPAGSTSTVAAAERGRGDRDGDDDE